MIPDPVPPTSVGAKTPGILNSGINYSSDVFLKHHFENASWERICIRVGSQAFSKALDTAGSPEVMMVSKLGPGLFSGELTVSFRECSYFR